MWATERRISECGSGAGVQEGNLGKNGALENEAEGRYWDDTAAVNHHIMEGGNATIPNKG